MRPNKSGVRRVYYNDSALSGMHRPLLSLGLALVGATLSSATQFVWFNRQILDRIQVSGYRYLGYHSHQVSGDQETFNSLTYYGQGARRFTDTGQITLSGRNVLGALNFDATILDSRFRDPQNEKISLNYRKDGWTVDAGDIYGSLLNTNAFASFSKTLKGASVGYRKGPFAAKVLRTDTKASSRTVSILGINSSGPYYLSSSQIIRGSETVTVDDEPMTLGKDYFISYEIGAITFIDRVIAPTSTILVTYESLDFNASADTVQGGGVSYDIGKFGRVGLTYIEQKSRSRGGLSSTLEQFEGFGAAGTPYFLQFEPMNTAQYPTQIRVNGILQTESLDYYFDPNNKSIFYFRRFIPASSLVEVLYYPRPTSVVDGDRRVTGFDYRLPFGDRGYLQFSQALGELKNDVTPLRGVARGIQASYQSGGWEIKGGWRDVPDSFVTIESKSFNRNEKAIDFGVEYKKKGFTYGASHRNSAVSTRSTDDTGNPIVTKGRQTNTRAYAGYSSAGWTWDLEQLRRTVETIKGQTQLDTTSLSSSKSYGKLDVRYGIDHQTGFSPNETGKRTQLALDTARLDFDYRPTSAWTLGWRTGLSRVRYGDQDGNGRDIGLTAAYRPNEAWSFNGSFTDSASGQLAALGGFQGLPGYDGNGFSSGALGTSFSAGSTNVREESIGARYDSGKRLGMEARATHSRSLGSLYTNTDTTYLKLGLDYDLGAGHSVSLGLQQTNTKFLDSPNASSTRSLDFGFFGRPAGPWSYRLGADAILSGGGPFAQDSLSLDGSLIYRIDDRQQTYMSFSLGRTTGYLPQDEQFLGFFYEYRLFKNVSLVASYKIRTLTNIDPSALGGNYRSRGFDLELSFNFGG